MIEEEKISEQTQIEDTLMKEAGELPPSYNETSTYIIRDRQELSKLMDDQNVLRGHKTT